MTLEFEFGALDLVSRLPSDDGYWFELLADGMTPGSPEAVKAVVATLMRDGEDERITRYGNRTFTFRVAVRAPDSEALHRGEAALAAELGGRSTITWMPPDGYGALTVYDVLNSTMDPEFDDLGLLRSPLQMVYSVTATCLPWPRSATPTEFATTAPSGETVLTIPVAGSVPTTGSLTISRPANPFEDVMVYCDPAMLDGFDPSNPATWAAAPAGRYLVYVPVDNVIGSEDINTGDVVVVTVTVYGRTQTIRTRAEVPSVAWAWIPVGEVDLGSNRDGTIGGPVSINGTKNGIEMTTESYRIFRMDTDTSLIVVNSLAASDVDDLVIDTPSVDYPGGGVWFDGVDALDSVDSWDFPVLAPPETAIWVKLGGAFDADVTVTMYDRWHTFAASSS